MNKRKNYFLITWTAVSLFLAFGAGNAFGYIAANGAGVGYCDPGSDPGCDESTSGAAFSLAYAPIESYIEEGGGYFLNAFSTVLALSNRVEMTNLAGVDRDELRKIVDNGLENIADARYTYSILIRAAGKTPYNPDVLLKLKEFDYRGFMTAHSLNPVIFHEVEEYLENGDITGIFKYMDSGFHTMEQLLLSVKTKTDLNRLPELTEVWTLNETASHTLIFAQYVARIFSELSK